MLQELLKEIDVVPSVVDGLQETRRLVEEGPKKPEDLLALVKLAAFGLDKNNSHNIDHNIILRQFSNCRQVLVQTDDYFYI